MIIRSIILLLVIFLPSFGYWIYLICKYWKYFETVRDLFTLDKDYIDEEFPINFLMFIPPWNYLVLIYLIFKPIFSFIYDHIINPLLDIKLPGKKDETILF